MERKLTLSDAQARLKAQVELRPDHWKSQVDLALCDALQEGIIEAILCEDGEVRYRRLGNQ